MHLFHINYLNIPIVIGHNIYYYLDIMENRRYNNYDFTTVSSFFILPY